MSAEKISTDKKKIFKPAPISGFPEWLPEVRAVEQGWLDHIRRVFESYGYCNIETPAVEALDAIRAKGEDVDKEIYVLERLHKDENDAKEARLALHFDQTVPMARYVAQHFNELDFPFKRYQMQKVWRGERPQMGRMREFYQCDIDVINVDQLPLHFDAEVAAVMFEILSGLDIGRVQLRISTRKVWMGFLDSLDIHTKEGGTTKLDQAIKAEILSDIDKLEKIGKEVTLQRIEQTCLVANYGFSVQTLIAPFLDLCEKKYATADSLVEAIQSHREINGNNPIMKEGIEELSFVMDQLAHLPEGAAVVDLSIVRGLDYYTGTVYETQLENFQGSICSGGRYDDLAGSYINKHLPGVGISIGFSRLFDVMRQSGKLPVGRKCPTDILVALWDEESRGEAAATAHTLRGNGWNVELYHAPQKIGKQFGYAEKKGIPYVWLPPSENENFHQIKDMTAKEQKPADPKTWVKT
ncbi:MAG TPA: histidine--tRNA ligase [Alphaproteobacteria bacterium]|nr:histidine--tRNA ligase [Alphaproteobacteria bacterium]